MHFDNGYTTHNVSSNSQLPSDTSRAINNIMMHIANNGKTATKYIVNDYKDQLSKS